MIYKIRGILDSKRINDMQTVPGKHLALCTPYPLCFNAFFSAGPDKVV